MSKLLIILFVCFFALLPKVAFGLAGWGEFETECYYTSEIIIDFGNPSDMCSPDHGNQACFSLYNAGDRYGLKGFKKIDQLTSIGIATSDKPKFIIGKSYIDSNWLIYDIEKDEEIMHDLNYEKVLIEWKNLGNPEPIIVSTKNFSKYFNNETEESKKRNAEQEEFGKGMIFAMLFVFGIPIVPIVVIGLLILWYLENKKNQHK